MELYFCNKSPANSKLKYVELNREIAGSSLLDAGSLSTGFSIHYLPLTNNSSSFGLQPEDKTKVLFFFWVFNVSLVYFLLCSNPTNLYPQLLWLSFRSSYCLLILKPYLFLITLPCYIWFGTQNSLHEAKKRTSLYLLQMTNVVEQFYLRLLTE